MIAGFIAKRLYTLDTLCGSREHLVTSQTFIIIEDFLRKNLSTPIKIIHLSVIWNRNHLSRG